jgi:hypothetical protein
MQGQKPATAGANLSEQLHNCIAFVPIHGLIDAQRCRSSRLGSGEFERALRLAVLLSADDLTWLCWCIARCRWRATSEVDDEYDAGGLLVCNIDNAADKQGKIAKVSASSGPAR